MRRMSAPLPKVLVVEDDAAIRSLMVAALKREPLWVETAADGAQAIEKIEEHDYAVILVDLMLPRVDGFDVLRRYRELRPEARAVVFVMTAYDDAALRKLDPTLVHGCLRKPFDIEWLVELVRTCAEMLPNGVTAPPPLPLDEDEDESEVRRP